MCSPVWHLGFPLMVEVPGRHNRIVFLWSLITNLEMPKTPLFPAEKSNFVTKIYLHIIQKTNKQGNEHRHYSYQCPQHKTFLQIYTERNLSFFMHALLTLQIQYCGKIQHTYIHVHVVKLLGPKIVGNLTELSLFVLVLTATSLNPLFMQILRQLNIHTSWEWSLVGKTILFITEPTNSQLIFINRWHEFNDYMVIKNSPGRNERHRMQNWLHL